MGPSHPIRIVGLGAGGTRWDRPTPIKLTGGKRWDRQTQFSMRWDRPNPVSGLKNYKKRKGWGMGWSLGHRRCAPSGLVTAPSVVVIRLRFQMGSVLLRQFRVSSRSISVHPGMEQSSSSLTRTQIFIDIHCTFQSTQISSRNCQTYLNLCVFSKTCVVKMYCLMGCREGGSWDVRCR